MPETNGKNGNSHVSRFWFVYVIGGIIGFSMWGFSIYAGGQEQRDFVQDNNIKSVLEKVSTIDTNVATLLERTKNLGVKEIQK